MKAQEEDKPPGQSQIMPNKTTENLDEFAQCEDLYKVLWKKHQEAENTENLGNSCTTQKVKE